MRVWINQGGGAFAQSGPAFPAPAVICGAFPEPRAIVPGDVDADGDVDLVVSIWCSLWGSTQLELFRNNGNGTFVSTLLPWNPALIGFTTYLQALMASPAHVTNLEIMTVLGV
jgi:hypothetical protein